MAALIGGYLGAMAATTRSDSGRPAASMGVRRLAGPLSPGPHTR
jgi:hypothetical protein